MIALSEAFNMTIGLILIFFVVLPGIAQGLIAFAVGQALGERKRNAENRRSRNGNGTTAL